MKVKDLVKLLQRLPQEAYLVKDNPDARDDGLGHWFIPRFLHLVGFEKEQLEDALCIKFKYSKENRGWEDNSLSAVKDGRFFKVNNLKAEDFVWASEKQPTEDGNYLCICKHSSGCTVETQSFYAKVMANGYVRADDQWGFSCEHIPAFCSSRSYPVIMWSPKSYKPFPKFEADIE